MILEIPENAVEQTEMEPSELLLEFAVFLFQQKKLNLEKAARLANLSEKAFQKVLAARQFTLEDLEPRSQVSKNGKSELPGASKPGFDLEKILKEKNMTKAEWDEIQRIIEKGVEKSSFGDALEWQKKEREDRLLPFSER